MKNIFYNSHVLVGLHTALIVSIIYMLINADYQIRFYQALVRQATNIEMNDQEKVLALMNASYSLVNKSNEVFDGSIQPGLKERLFGSSEEIVAGGGSCGGFIHVTGRALKTAGYQIRIAQMKANGVYGKHIILEVLLNEKYRILDPSYNVAYINQAGELATFQELNNNWAYFSKQAPANYNMAYNYTGVRYTNWNKIPVISPVIKAVLTSLWGKNTIDHLSIRVYLLEAYRTRAWLLGILYIGVLALTLLTTRKRKSNQNKPLDCAP